jgi:hypothetical protein
MEIPSLLMAGSLFVQALRLDLPAYKRPLLPPFCSAFVEISRDLTKTGFSLLLALLPVRSGDHDRHQVLYRSLSTSVLQKIANPSALVLAAYTIDTPSLKSLLLLLNHLSRAAEDLRVAS